MKYHDKKDAFLEKDIEIKDPYDLFKKWLDIACGTPEILEPNAMCLSTVNKFVFLLFMLSLNLLNEII